MPDLKDVAPKERLISSLSSSELRSEAKRIGMDHKGGRDVLIERIAWAVRCSAIARQLTSAREELEGFRASKLLANKIDGSQAALRVSLGALISMYGVQTFRDHFDHALSDSEFVASLSDKEPVAQGDS